MILQLPLRHKALQEKDKYGCEGNRDRICDE